MKAPTDIASYRGSRNLVMVWSPPDVDKILPQNPTSSTSQYLPECSDGVSTKVRRDLLISGPPLLRDSRITFRAFWNQRNPQEGFRKGDRVGCHRNTTSREPWTWQSLDVREASNIGIRSEPRLNRPPFTEALSGRCFLSAELRSDSLYQPLFGSNPAESSGQKVSSRTLIPALQASKGSELSETI